MRNLKLSVFNGIRGLSILVIMIGFSAFAIAQKAVINVLTYNIRFANPDDEPNTWDQRKEKVFSLVRETSPDVFGLQEALRSQVSDFEKAFPGFTRVGVGRDDGKESGEYSPLLFNSKKYTLVSSGTFWLSQAPALAGSRGWDAACNRVVTWVQLEDKKSKVIFFVLCTHFDHIGEIARRNSANLLLHASDSLAGYKPVVVLGDFNSVPGSEPYNIITDFSNRLHMKDARLICTDLKGPEYTFTGFKVGAQPGIRIDYIFVKNNVQVLSFNVNEANNGEYYPSDHLPVNATLKIF